MKLDITNPPEPEPCPTCGTVTETHYEIQPGTADSRYGVCEACLEQEISKHNDGLYGVNEWIEQDRRRLSKSELVQVIETEFIRDATVFRYGYKHPHHLFKEHDHRDKVTELIDEERLAVLPESVGVDEADAACPPADRQVELIRTYELWDTWDTSQPWKETIKEFIETELGHPVAFH